MTRPPYVHPDAVEIEDDPVEEPEDACLRRELGLRPIHYPTSGEGHPDQRPCPSWCWHGQEGVPHEATRQGWTMATHTPNVRPSVAVSVHSGVIEHLLDGEYHVVVPTIAFQLKQRGANKPRIGLTLRGAQDDANEWGYRDLVSLTAEDAKEVITVLQYLVDMVEKG